MADTADTVTLAGTRPCVREGAAGVACIQSNKVALNHSIKGNVHIIEGHGAVVGLLHHRAVGDCHKTLVDMSRIHSSLKSKARQCTAKLRTRHTQPVVARLECTVISQSNGSDMVVRKSNIHIGQGGADKADRLAVDKAALAVTWQGEVLNLIGCQCGRAVVRLAGKQRQRASSDGDLVGVAGGSR